MKFKLCFTVLLIFILFAISCVTQKLELNSLELNDNKDENIVPKTESTLQDLSENKDRNIDTKNLTLTTYTDESESFSFDMPPEWKVVTAIDQLFEIFKDSLDMQSTIVPVLFGIDESSGDNIFATLEFSELYQDEPQLIDIIEYTSIEIEKLKKVLFESESDANQNIIQTEVELDDGSYGFRIEIHHTEVPLLQIMYVLINPTKTGWCGSLAFLYTGSISNENGNENNLIQIDKILNSFKVQKAPENINCNNRETLNILNNTYD